MKRAVATVCLLAAFAVPAAASASDAQVKAAVGKGLAAAHLKGPALAAAVGKAHAALAAAAPSSPAGKAAKTAALQGLAKLTLAASEQVKAEAANTRMQYPTATAETAKAIKDVAAGVNLLKTAAAKLRA